MTTLSTARLALRPPRAEDAAAIAALLADFAVAGNLARVPHPYALADAEAWLAGRPANPGPGETVFMVEAENGAVAGSVGYHERGGGQAELGYYLGHAFWGRGLMTEAATAALDWYFAQTRAERVKSGVFHFNAASLAIQRKLGFVETGRSSLRCLARDQDIEHIDTELTRMAHAAASR